LGLREQLNQQSGLASGAVGVMVVVLLVFIGWQIRGKRPPADMPTAKYYFTSDDGHTWFVDDFNKVPPYDHDGAKAVRCRVFKCSNSAPFAGYLEAYTQELHDEMTGITKISGEHPPLSPSSDTLVKKPGGKNWVLSYTPEGQKIINVRCPNGASEIPQPVLPSQQ
jgi:hypothetical protein